MHFHKILVILNVTSKAKKSVFQISLALSPKKNQPIKKLQIKIQFALRGYNFVRYAVTSTIQLIRTNA